MHKKLFSPIILVILALLLFSSVSYAEQPPTEPGKNVESEKTEQSKFMSSDDLTDLNEAVAEKGTVRVIVGVTLPSKYSPEGLLPNSKAVQGQRLAISRGQEQVAKELSAKANVITNYDTIPYLVVEVNKADLATLTKSAAVETIQEDKAVSHSLASSTAVIGMPTVWSAGHDGSGQVVVILDTGIDAGHSFFGGRVVTQACFSNAGGSGGKVSLCPNGSSSQTGSGAANANVSACSPSLCNHGTHVAGIAAGNGSSFDGVARGASIIAIQVFTRFNDSASCNGSAPCVLSYTSDQLSALQYVNNTLANSYSIASVNMSLGGGQYSGYCDSDSRKATIDSLRSKGIATIIASGNAYYTNAVGAPGCISTAVTVGSTTDSDSVSSFSNIGTQVDLLAPGSSIQSSIPGGGYATYNGTSMATPHVAGTWAVLKEAAPSASFNDILNALTSTGVNVADSRSGGSYTKPRISVSGAVGALGNSDPCSPSQCDKYTGSLSGSSDYDIQPNGTYYYSSSGNHQGWLEGPTSGADFDLELYRWNGSSWSKVAQSISATSSEYISYNGSTGYYYWKVLSYSGSGSYSFWLDRP